ncbi:MAG: hypothetical protein AB7K71_12545 [Polyangiaceae bacterium]
MLDANPRFSNETAAAAKKLCVMLGVEAPGCGRPSFAPSRYFRDEETLC